MQLRFGLSNVIGSETNRSGSGKTLALCFFITLAVWLMFSWPLAKHFTGGIPCSSRNSEKDGEMYMAQGDHLQLLYHFWLVSDMIRGKTRPFYNPYEFNTGNDQDRYAPGTYYVPFSLFFAAMDFCAGRAAAWNLTGFLSLWLTSFFTWLIARRYTDNDLFAGIAAIASIVVPYRWVNLLGGSPSGFAIMWVPMLMFGLDRAVRDRSLSGGFIAGIALLFACFTDSHVFLFSAMITPPWCILALIRSADLNRRKF
mgnify:CR=1 FL=1